jgi:hypothetical protein
MAITTAMASIPEKLENPLLPSSLASFRSRLLLLLFFEFFSQI